MLELVPVGASLIEATAEVLLEICPSTSRDFSSAGMVFPSKRMIFFLREHLNQRLREAYLPPRMFTMDEFVRTIFSMNFPGHEVLSDMSAAEVVFEVVGREFGTSIYTGGDIPANFAQFFPWARQLLATIETLLVEGEHLDNVDARIFSEFASLGDYHRGYKDFIARLPAVTEAFMDSLLQKRCCTRGIMYRILAARAKEGDLVIPDLTHNIFSGINALNYAETQILKFYLQQFPCRLVLRSDAGALLEPDSPFAMQRQTLGILDLLPRDLPGTVPLWNQFGKKVDLYAVPNTETQMVQVSKILQGILTSVEQSLDLKRIAVILPDSASLIPFVHGVVSRISQDGVPLPFNITLGYPFLRTPLFQLINAMLEVAGSLTGGGVHAGHYLNLIRHPYVKLTGEEGRDAVLRTGIRRIEDFITANNLLRFDPREVAAALQAELVREDDLSEEDVASILAAIRRLHSLFLADPGFTLSQLAEFLKIAVLEIQEAGTSYLFLKEYVTTAVNILDEICDFSGQRDAEEEKGDFNSTVQLIRHYFLGAQIYFEGSPLKGIQVMGMLESRGLDFDEVIFLDVEEGILPRTRKYDPLLPHDVGKIFGIRGYPDWDTLFSFNFFSLLATAKKAHILWIENRGGMENSERSRFVERILYETERQTGTVPSIHSKNTRGSLGWVARGPVVKTDWMMKRILGMILSPSALESYIRCPIRFYFGSMLGLEERALLVDDADAGILGTVIHSVLERFYGDVDLSGSWDSFEMKIDGLLMEEMHRQGFTVETGVRRIRHWVTLEKLMDFVRFDLTRMRDRSIRIVGMEETLEFEYAVPGTRTRLKTRGRIDRVEEEEDCLRLLDYKTGGRFTVSTGKEALEGHFENLYRLPEDEYLSALGQLSRGYKNFQMLYYLNLAHHCWERDYQKMDGVYCFLKHSDGYHRSIFGNREEANKADLLEEFSGHLSEILRDLCLRDRFLANRSDPRHCRHCPFVILCGG